MLHPIPKHLHQPRERCPVGKRMALAARDARHPRCAGRTDIPHVQAGPPVRGELWVLGGFKC